MNTALAVKLSMLKKYLCKADFNNFFNHQLLTISHQNSKFYNIKMK